MGRGLSKLQDVILDVLDVFAGIDREAAARAAVDGEMLSWREDLRSYRATWAIREQVTVWPEFGDVDRANLLRAVRRLVERGLVEAMDVDQATAAPWRIGAGAHGDRGNRKVTIYRRRETR